MYQLEATTKAGEVVYVVYMDVSARPIVKDGVIVAFQSVARDISERYLAKQRLAGSEQRYRSLFHQNLNAVFSLDPRGNCLTANPACKQIAGYPIEAILATHWSALVAPEDHPRTLRHIASAARGDAQAFEISILRKPGERARLHVTTLPIIVNGHIVGITASPKMRPNAAPS